MRFRAERDALADALGIATRAAARSGPSLGSGGVRLDLHGEDLVALGTDAEMSLEVSLAVEGARDGSGVVPGRLVLDLVRALPTGVVHVEAEGDEVHLSGGRSSFTVRCAPEADFARPPVLSGEAVQVDAAAFAGALRQVVRAASTDALRASLTGVLLAAQPTGIRLVATDSYRLSLRDLPGTTLLEEGRQVVLPAHALAELARLLPAAGQLDVVVGEREALFSVGKVRLLSRIIGSDFPNYQALFPPQYPNHLVVAKEPFVEAVRRMRLLNRDQATPVRVSLHEDRVELAASALDVGQGAEDLDARYEGEEASMAFNPTYLIEGLDGVTGDEVMVELSDPSKAVLIRDVSSVDYRYILMPVRVP